MQLFTKRTEYYAGLHQHALLRRLDAARPKSHSLMGCSNVEFASLAIGVMLVAFFGVAGFTNTQFRLTPATYEVAGR